MLNAHRSTVLADTREKRRTRVTLVVAAAVMAGALGSAASLARTAPSSEPGIPVAGYGIYPQTEVAPPTGSGPVPGYGVYPQRPLP